MLCRFFADFRKRKATLVSLCVALCCTGCDSSFNKDVYSDASQKGRILPDPEIVLVSPAAARQFYRTDETLSIRITTPVDSADIRYAVVGVSDFQAYSGTITINYADTSEYDRRLLAYVTHPDYTQSAVVERQYLFLVDNGVATVAGGYDEGYWGDGSPGTDAALSGPSSCVAVGDTVYFSDTGNHCVRQISPDGIISTIAGTGVAGRDPAQEGGPATSAQLSSPRGLSTDSAGNLFVADSGNHRIVRIDASGTFTTIAGTGSPGYMAADEGGPAVEARLSSPSGVFAAPSGIIYIADTGNHRIRRISPAATVGDPDVIATIAGTDTAGYAAAEDGLSALAARLFSPEGVCATASGTVYVADTGNNRIRKLTPAAVPEDPAIISTVAGTGTAAYDESDDGGDATAASLSGPSGVFLSAANVLLVADAGNNRVRRIALSSAPGTPGTITTLAGSGQESGYAGDYSLARDAVFDEPHGVCADDDGNIIIADTGNNRIRMVIQY